MLQLRSMQPRQLLVDPIELDAASHMSTSSSRHTMSHLPPPAQPHMKPGAACDMTCTWQSDEPLLRLVPEPIDASDAELHLRLLRATRCVQPTPGTPCSLSGIHVHSAGYIMPRIMTRYILSEIMTHDLSTVAFASPEHILHVHVVSSAPVVEVYVGHRTPRGELCFTYGETAFGNPDKHVRGAFRLDYAWPEPSAAADAIALQFAEVGDAALVVHDIDLVLLPQEDQLVTPPPTMSRRSNPSTLHGQHNVQASRRRSFNPDPSPSSSSYEPQLMHTHPPARHAGRHSNNVGHPEARRLASHRPSHREERPRPTTLSGHDIMPPSARSLPDARPPPSSSTSPTAKETLATMKTFLDKQQSMLNAMEARICATLDAKAETMWSRLETAESIVTDLQARLESLQQDKEIVFAGIAHRLTKLEGHVAGLQQTQVETTAAVQLALAKAAGG
ncbi:Aste57867_24168 [Aphanomyces stellatus]|uniref:Aste57867_24168 protein n=1 Tax=Aphanomyces stellatus TaxID=120398 RepID=A0A485LRH6_9STRA|nr:hypothetical protein As57867_024094 [Aphanomyces stellatus]VFU00810.1 Aste57867_24168 [Aphanomyces stellatus]